MKLLIGCAFMACMMVVGCRGESPTLTPTPKATPTPEATAAPTATVQELGRPTGTVHAMATPTPDQVATVTPISQSPSEPSGPTLTTTSPPTTPSPVTVTISSSSERASLGQEFTFDVSVDPQGRGISGVQVWIEYDPSIFQVVGVEPGALLGEEPAEAGPIIDEVEGVFQYAAARIGETHTPTSPGLFAAVKLLVLDTVIPGNETSLKITQVKIPDQDIREIRGVLIGEELRLEISR